MSEPIAFPVRAPQNDSPAAGAPLEPANLIILQPTAFCNIDCDYCYLAHRTDTKLMTQATVDAIVRFLADVPFAQEPLTVCWHAGEPLVAPLDFYERAFAAFAAGPRRVRQNIQTNGTLITDDWCQLFKKWSVQIGLSIDGPKALHDLHRQDRAGRGTFDRVVEGIARMRAHDVPFSIIAVLTRDSLGRADELWQFFKSMGVHHVGFNIDEWEGVHGASSLSSRDDLAAFRRFMGRIAELHDGDPDLKCREIEDMRRHLSAPVGAEVERADNRPGAILTLDADGNVVTFSPELLGQRHDNYGTFAWCNVHTGGWSDLARHPGFQRAHADIQAGIALCRKSCGYFTLCGGGCPSNKLAEHGTFVSTETQCCRFHIQAVSDVVIERVEREFGLAVAAQGGTR